MKKIKKAFQEWDKGNRLASIGGYQFSRTCIFFKSLCIAYRVKFADGNYSILISDTNKSFHFDCENCFKKIVDVPDHDFAGVVYRLNRISEAKNRMSNTFSSISIEDVGRNMWLLNETIKGVFKFDSFIKSVPAHYDEELKNRNCSAIKFLCGGGNTDYSSILAVKNVKEVRNVDNGKWVSRGIYVFKNTDDAILCKLSNDGSIIIKI